MCSALINTPSTITFFFTATATTEIYTLSLHDALPILTSSPCARSATRRSRRTAPGSPTRSEEHTSELQSHHDLVCRLLLEKKKIFIRVQSLYRHRTCYNYPLARYILDMPRVQRNYNSS